jgi:hypothetical protein
LINLSGKNNFQEILEEIRKDISFLKNDLYNELERIVFKDSESLRGTFYVNDSGFKFKDEVRSWIMDVFLDKFFEIDVKIRKILNEQMNCKMAFPIGLVKQDALNLAFSSYSDYGSISPKLSKLKKSIEMYIGSLEDQMSTLRQELHTAGWNGVRKLNAADYVLPIERATYISSRQELEKAKQAVKDKQWDEVLNHLRPAVDLAIKEKFGFTKIQPMKSFISEAERFGLPLPSYTMLYDIFDEGSKRIHEGKLNTSYECQRALEFVAGFIDRLDLIQIDQQKIDAFKQSCRCVE